MSKEVEIFETFSNQFKVVNIIGEGGSGKVFQVTDEENNNFALKVLTPEKNTTEKRKRFKNEINFCFKNKHKNIIKIFDFGYVNIKNIKCPFYVMPIYSKTLRKLIDDKINHDDILKIFSNILDGIEAAHLQGIFHRDLKPENILYNSVNDIVIADFGIAHFQEEFLLTEIETHPSSKLANIRYSSPEQRVKGNIIDQKSDIFSLGLILNEMFTNEVPQGTGFTQISLISSNYSYLDKIIEKMIQHKAGSRYSSIEEIKKDLIGYKNEFITRQELDRKKSEVLPKITINDFEDIKPINFDYKGNDLIFELNRIPESNWIQIFKSPGDHSFLIGYEPGRFEFRNKSVIISRIYDENLAKQIVPYFKSYIELANKGYIKFISNEAIKKENELRNRLKKEIEDAEKRKRLLENVKL